MKRIPKKTQAWIMKMDDRTKRRIKEMDKIKRTGTSTEFDKGYNLWEEKTKETEYYMYLWDSLDFDELQSMRKSNRFPMWLLKQYKIYLPFRVIKEAIPIVAICGVASVIMDIIKKCQKCE